MLSNVFSSDYFRVGVLILFIVGAITVDQVWPALIAGFWPSVLMYGTLLAIMIFLILPGISGS